MENIGLLIQIYLYWTAISLIVSLVLHFDIFDLNDPYPYESILCKMFKSPLTLYKEYREEFKYTKLRKFWSITFICAKTILRSIIVLPITLPLFPIIIVISVGTALFCLLAESYSYISKKIKFSKIIKKIFYKYWKFRARDEVTGENNVSHNKRRFN